jgi:hypothetical protein
MPTTSLFPAAIAVLIVAILIVATLRLGLLFARSTTATRSPATASLWQKFSAATRLEFAVGLLLIVVTIAAFRFLANGSGLETFALVLIAMGCGGSGTFFVVGAVGQRRRDQRIEGNDVAIDHSVAVDMIALGSAIGAGIALYLLSLYGLDGFVHGATRQGYFLTIMLAGSLAAFVDYTEDPQFNTIALSEPELRPRNLLALLIWFPFSVAGDSIWRVMSPLFGNVKDSTPFLPDFEVIWCQNYLLALWLSTLCVVLLLPTLRSWLAPIRQLPSTSAVFLGLSPAVLMALMELTPAGQTVLPPLSPIMIALAAGGIVAIVVWHACEGLIGWLRRYWASRRVERYPFQFLSVAILILVGWIGIFQVEGIDRYCVFIAQCAALSTWIIRRLS